MSYLKVVGLGLAKKIDKGLGWMESASKAVAEAGVGSTVNNAVTRVRETKRSIVISIISLVSLGYKNDGLNWRGNTSFENVLKVRRENYGGDTRTNPPSGVRNTVGSRTIGGGDNGLMKVGGLRRRARRKRRRTT